MRQPAQRQRVAEGAHQRILADQFGKPVWSIFAR